MLFRSNEQPYDGINKETSGYDETYEFLPQKYFTWKSICIFYEVCSGFEGIEGSG